MKPPDQGLSEPVISNTTPTIPIRTTAPGAINGSIYLPEKPRTPTIVIDVPDIKAHIKKVKDNGGTLVDDITEIPGMGMYARFRDPEGNLMGLWQTL